MKKMYKGYTALVLIMIAVFTTTTCFAQTIKGKITDTKTAEPLSGASVILKGTNETFTTAINLDGTYAFKKIPEGTYSLTIKFVGYESIPPMEVIATKGKPVIYNQSLRELSRDLEEITVKNSINKESDQSARLSEKNADIVQNILSARAIELSPDLTVSAALQRMSGVTIERSNSGEARHAIIRGMDQRYNNTLINGIKIPSPDDKYRYVPMNLFPSDLLERLEVNKTLTPSMEGDAIGGSMNMVMKNAPNKFIFTAHASAGTDLLFHDRSFAAFSHSDINLKSPAEIHGQDYVTDQTSFPRKNLDTFKQTDPINFIGGFTIGNRFLKKKKLGAILGVSYQNIYLGSDTYFFKPDAEPSVTPHANTPQFDDIFIRQYSTRDKRVAVNNKLDYVFNNNHKISLYNFFVRMDQFQTLNTVDTALLLNGRGLGPGNGTVRNSIRTRWQIQSIYNATLRGDHTFSKTFNLNWIAAYSIAKNNIPDLASYEVDDYVVNNQLVPAQSRLVQNWTNTWQHNSDQDRSAYLNLNYNPIIAKRVVEFTFGGMFRHKDRDTYHNSYSLGSSPKIEYFTTFDSTQYNYSSSNVAGSKGEGLQILNNYTSTEEITAAYIQTKFMITRKFQVLGGVRMENTDQHYNTQAHANVSQNKGHIWYTDLLPSVHFKYLVTNKQNVRLSYYKAISRPSFFDLVPAYDQNFNDDYYVKGNPFVNHTVANNFDLRYEYFPDATSQLLVGTYYKDIQKPIEQLIHRLGAGTQYLYPDNVGTANNYGVELVFTKYFGKFGVSVNYTYTKSKITTQKIYKFNGVTRDTSILVNQTRPLQGQSDHIGNIALLYKNHKLGLDAQIALVYTGERISGVSLYYNLDNWQKPYTQLDASFDKRINKHFFFYAKAHNLTNSINKLVLKQQNTFITGPNALPKQEDNNRILVQSDTYNTSFLGGIRYKF